MPIYAFVLRGREDSRAISVTAIGSGKAAAICPLFDKCCHYTMLQDVLD